MKYPFAGRNRVTQAWSGNHYGLDIVGDDDKTVHAVIGGKVLQSRRVYTGRTAEWGNYVSIQGTDGNTYYYCHLTSRAVKQGQTIAEGAAIGVMGNTGKSYGAHLHLQIRNAAAREINVADVIGMPNRIGTYIENTAQTPNSDVANVTPASPKYKITVSGGDMSVVETTIAELQLPCAKLCTYTVEVSNGDYPKLKDTADKVGVALEKI